MGQLFAFLSPDLLPPLRHTCGQSKVSNTSSWWAFSCVINMVIGGGDWGGRKKGNSQARGNLNKRSPCHAGCENIKAVACEKNAGLQDFHLTFSVLHQYLFPSSPRSLVLKNAGQDKIGRSHY